MPKLICEFERCKDRNPVSRECEYTGKVYTMDFAESCDTDNDSEAPNCFSSVLNLPDYQDVFWKTMFDPQSKKMTRKQAKGKRVEIGGFTAYAEIRMPKETEYADCAVRVTESVTGALIAINQLAGQKYADKIRGAQATKKVMDYPEKEVRFDG